jgi:hypothetical protein
MTAAVNLQAGTRDLLADLSELVPLTVAWTLALLDVAVFPVHGVTDRGGCTCGKGDCRNVGKHPRTSNGLRDATRDLDRIGAWWQQWPEANIGVATGAGSDLWVLDIDPASGGEATFADLEATHGAIEPTWCVESGGGGFHLWFRSPDAPLQTTAGRLGPGLDVRAEGGYIIVPPSRHRSGNMYHWASGWHPTQASLVAAPAWLLELLHRPPPQKMIPPDAYSIKGKRGGNHSQALSTMISEGARNATMTSLAGAMRRKGCGERAIVAALLVENVERCTPPLPEAEIATIARSVCRYAPESTNTTIGRRSRGGFVEFVHGRAVTR